MRFNITPAVLEKIAGAQGNDRVLEGLVEHLPEIMETYEINTPLRASHFLAQLAHESDHFRTLEEYASGSDYEGRRDLGNVKRGDGRRYKGRGPIQITGRFNYRKYGNLLGIDLENNPELAETPKVGLLIAAEYWNQNDLNSLADKDAGKHITRRINGGYNGLHDRLHKVERAKNILTHIHTPAPVNKPEPSPVYAIKEEIFPKVVEKTLNTVVEPQTEKSVTVPLPIFTQAPLYDPSNEPGDDASEFVQQQLRLNDEGI